MEDLKKQRKRLFKPFKSQPQTWASLSTRIRQSSWKHCPLLLYKEPQVTQAIRSNRLRWLGHMWRSPENDQTRAHTFKNPMGSRTRGRPPTRWIDDVENDLKTLNIKNWQRVAAHRWNWRK
ncbi:endonuclease-reverse transcriptase [Trichonephila clavipes]|nr:endonuclease-reverse transcriptase [Trichonephila clavipes]